MDIYSEKKAVKDLNTLYAEAVYGNPKASGNESDGGKKDMIVTRADKKANTPAYQNYKKGVKGYAAADHLKNEEYAELYAEIKGQKVPTTEAYGTKSTKKKKKHDCASKVKHEQFGIGNCIKGMHDLDENGVVQHYDVFFEHGVEKNVPVTSLKILEGSMHEHVIHEKMAAKDYDGDGKVESGTDEYMGSRDKAIKKAMGKKARKESYRWRDELVEYSNTVDEPQSKAMKKVKETNVKNKVVIDPEVKLEQALGGEVEVLEGHGGGKKSEKNSGCGQNPCVTYGKGGKMDKVKEDILWDRVAEALDELGEMNEVQFKVSPMTEEEILVLNWEVFDEGYQRDPEKGEAAAKKADTRTAKQKRMDSPDRGINSPAFKEFMKQYGG